MSKNIIIYLITLVLLSSCGAVFQTYTLDNEYATSLHFEGATGGIGEVEDTRKGVLAKSYYNGDLLGGAIWWKRSGLKLDKEDEFIVIADSAANTPFGATFPPLDFITDKVKIKVTAYAEGIGGLEPTLQLIMVDGSGYETNAKPSTIVVKNSDDTKDYYFELSEEMFQQSTPREHKVNGGLINSIMLVVNPEGPAYYGKIYIDAIKIVSME